MNYQRGYAWVREQLDEFLEDLELLPRGSVHYTGNIVLHCVDGAKAKDKLGKTYNVFDIVDGQQRLTTIVLLLDATKGDLVMERDLAADPDWDEGALLQRRRQMVAWAKERWGLPK